MKVLEGIYRVGMEEPVEVKTLIDACIGPESGDVPVKATGQAVEGFRWPITLEKTSIFAWTRLLDRLDEFLTYITKSNISTLLDPELELKPELPVTDDEVLAALDCSLEVLRHVAGKEHYNSLPQLCDLLASSNPAIVNKTLLLLQNIYERNVSGFQSVPADLANRLQAIAVPPCGPGLLDIGKRDVAIAKEKDTMHLKFSIEPNPSEHVDERTEEEKQFGTSESRIVKFSSRSELPPDDFVALKSIMDAHGPVRGRRQRFRLLCSIRAAGIYAFSPDELELEACNRLLAATVLVPVGVLGEVYGRVHETFRKLGADELLREIFSEESTFTDKIILCGLQAFTAKFVGSERSSYKMDGLDKLLLDGKYSPLGLFLERRCSRPNMNSELRVNVAKEAISMVNALCNLAYLSEKLLEADVLECVVPFVSDMDPTVRDVCERCLTTIELLFTNSTSGVNRLNECNGFDLVQGRLRIEVENALSSLSIVYDDRYLIKKLLQALTRIVMTSDTSGIDEKKVGVLYWAIKEVFVGHEKFGCGVFDAATSCFRQLLHFDPLQYKAMASLGLDVSYLGALSNMRGRDSSVSLNIIPTISAICLSEDGRELVKSKSAVHVIADTFTDVQALCLLPPSHAIGRSLEEMIRHHETMLSDVVEMMVSAVDVVRKIAHTGEIELAIEERIVRDLPSFISIAISRLTELLIPVCETNKAAAKAFLEQGGLQMFIDLAQPKLCVDCFSCTQAGHSVASLLRALILLEEQREYALEVTLSNLRSSLDDVNRLFIELEKEEGYCDDFCLSTWQQKSFKLKFEDLIGAISKSTILLSGFAFRRAGGTEHKGHALFIDSNLCILPDLERSIGRVIRLLAVSDDWRINMDMEWKESSAGDNVHLDQVDNQIELRRDALNLFFRSICTFYNNIGRLGDNAKLVWSEQHGYAAPIHEEAQEVIGLLTANGAIRVLADLVQREKGGVELERHAIRACRFITAVLFDQRKKTLFSCSINVFARYGGLDLLLKATNRITGKCLKVSGTGDNTFIPTVKEIKEQERSLEITGVGRKPLEKDLAPSEWERRSVIISTQHALLSILGVLEILTAREAYKKDGEACLRPILFEPPYWVTTAADSLQKELVHPICRHTGASLQTIGLGRAWSMCPLALTKYLKCLSNCQKGGMEYLTRYSVLDAGPVDVNLLNERLDKDRERQPFAQAPNTNMDLQAVINQFPGFRASIILDAFCRPRMEERLKLRERNQAAANQRKSGKFQTLWILDDKSMQSKSFEMSTFSVVMPLKGNKRNLKAAKQMIEKSPALAHVILSGDATGAWAGSPISIGEQLDPVASFSTSMLKSSLSDLLVLVRMLPSNVHDIADALVQCYGQEKVLCASLISKFESHISDSVGRIDSMSSQDLEGWASEGNDDILGPLMHLLVAVINTSSLIRREFSQSIMTLVLKLLDIWRLGCIAVKKSKAGNRLRVPKWVDASLLSLALVCEEKFKPDKQALEKDSNPGSDAPPMENFVSKIRDMLPPVEDSGDVAHLVSAATHAIDCLKISLKYVEHGWVLSKKDDAQSSERFYDPCPRSSVSASLELLATTSKVRKAASTILNSRGHNLVLSLSEPLHTVDCDKLVAKILRHLVEDDEALQASMEATIRSGMQKKRGGLLPADDPHGYKTLSMKQFISSFLHLACRDSVIFSKAVENTCQFSKEGSIIRVDWKSAQKPNVSDDVAAGSTGAGTETPRADALNGSAMAEAGPPASRSEEKSHPPMSSHNDSKPSSKKANKKIPQPVTTVMDAIIGRLLQTSTPMFVQKMAEMSKKNVVDSTQALDPRLTAELYCIYQQTLCINLLTTLLASFSNCVTAFLRRDADPLQEWVVSKQSGKSPAKALLHTPIAKGVGEEDSKGATTSKKSKTKEPKAPHSMPKCGKPTLAASGSKSKALSDMCFLIHSIIRNQVAYHSSSRNVPLRQALSKDACSLVITLSQRSKEGQVRVCRELGFILRSFAYYPNLSITSTCEDPSLHGYAVRSLEKMDVRSISADLEGSLVLLATMLSLSIPGQLLSQGSLYQKELIESLLSTGFIEVLVDVIACIDLHDVTDRTKVCLSAIIRSLEKLTSVRATDKPADQDGDADLANNFEELIAHLNERGWHLAGETEDEGLDTEPESNSDDGVGMDMDIHSDSDVSDNPSYPSFLSDTSYSSLSDHGGYDIGMGESGDDSIGVDDVHERDAYSSEFSSSSGHISGSMDDDDSGADTMDHSDIDHDDEDHMVRDYELDYHPELEDIFPPDETEFDGADFDNTPMEHWRHGEPSDFDRVRRDLIFNARGDSEEEDGLLDGNDAEEYYTDEEYDEDSASAPFGDDRLVTGHSLANTTVPGFWMQENEGERAIHWRDADPLFGTAFISPRLLSSHVRLFRRSSDLDAQLPASFYNHPLITRSYGGSSMHGSRPPFGAMMEDSLGSSRWRMSAMPLPFPGLGPLSVGFREHPLGDSRRSATWLPDRVVERFASAFDDSMSGRRPPDASRRRHRHHLLGLLDGEWGPDGERATSPTVSRPRQRQRTDQIQDSAANVMVVGEVANGLEGSGIPQATNSAGTLAPGAAGNIGTGPSEEAPLAVEEDLEPIDPEFLAALPPDLQREVLENREREVRARQMARHDRRRIETMMPFYMGEDLVSQESSEEDGAVDDGTEDDGGSEEGVADRDAGVIENIGVVGEAATMARALGTEPAPQTIPASTSNRGSHEQGQGERFSEQRATHPPRRPPQPFLRPMGGMGDLQSFLRDEGILPIDRGFLHDLEVLRADDGGIGPHMARLFETQRMMGAVRQRAFEMGTPGRDLGFRNINITSNPLRESSDRPIDMQSDRKPLLQENQIPHLIKLLRFSRWEGRLHLNRAIRHLTESKATAAQIFDQIFALLRCPLSSVEADTTSLSEVLTQLNHPMPSMLANMHSYIVAPHGASTIVEVLGLEPEDEADGEKGIIAISVVRRLLELLRHCFNLVKRGVDVILALDKVIPLYSVYHGMKLISSGPVPSSTGDSQIPALDVLLSLPLRHGISKGNLRGTCLELVCKFLTHFEKIEVEIRDKEQRIREKKMRAMKGNQVAQFPSITRLEVEKLEKERDALIEKAIPTRVLFKKINPLIIRNYVMMLTYPSLKESETDSVRMILQSLTMMNIDHWKTLCNAAAEFVEILSYKAGIDLREIASGHFKGKIWKPDTKGTAIFRCLQAVAEGVFQLVVDRFDPSARSLPDIAQKAREVAARALSEMLDLTKDTLWAPFNNATDAIEQVLKKEDMASKMTLPLPVQLVRPYVESYFLLHDTLRCSTCSLEVLAREISELTEEEEAWTNKREEIARAAEEQATASFTRIQSIDFNLLQMSAENPSPEKADNLAPCLPSSDSDFLRFAENHRSLVNLIASHAPSVLEESMNMLLKHPKLLDFENKRVHFRKRVQSLARQLSHHSRLTLNIRRPHAFEDSFNQLRVVSKSQLRSPLKVTFAGEEGVDAGGVSREWYQVMSREMFNPAISLFEAVPQGSSTYQPNPNSIVQTDEARGISHLDYFKFVGHVVGKALLDDQVIDAHFTRSFYKHMLGQPLTYKDIEGVDPDFFKNLTWMLDNSIDGVLDLTFSEENDFFGQKSVIELCPNGANVKVTDENKRDYVDAIARHRMTSAIEPQIHAFLEGFWNVLPRVSLQLFSDHELELMISGLPDVDVLDLRANCEYHGGYSATSQVILWFWEILISMDREQRALLLQFVTGTSKVPVGGFGELQAISGRQKFQIHKAYGDTNRLPTAHTCFNQLDLPEYNTKEQLRERLFLAIHEGKEGFGFA